MRIAEMEITMRFDVLIDDCRRHSVACVEVDTWFLQSQFGVEQGDEQPGEVAIST